MALLALAALNALPAHAADLIGSFIQGAFGPDE
jgi:hypothetical protein